MDDTNTCHSLRADGTPCKGKALPGSAFCFAHDPAYEERRQEGQRRGGKNKSNAARVAKQWAAVGREIDPDDLPAILRAMIVQVRMGSIEPAYANAIAALAKTSVAITVDIDLERRIEALEGAAGYHDGQRLRRVS